MHVIEVRNVHDALPEAISELRRCGSYRSSRAGDVVVHPEPVTTVYYRPDEKVIFWPERDANPFFHFFEALWMLAGRDDAETISKFNKRMRHYAEDAGYFHGAYGHRWREHFKVSTSPIRFDQLKKIGDALRADPHCRRQVLGMWDPGEDLGWDFRDIPCNTHVYFNARGIHNRLDMTVCCRSNDVVWGCYGSDAVTFGFLHEYVAARAGLPIGVYRQVSNNWHAYEEPFKKMKCLEGLTNKNPYRRCEVEPYPLMHEETDPDVWDEDLATLFRWIATDGPILLNWHDPFFALVVAPLYRAWDIYKNKQMKRDFRWRRAMEQISLCDATDWRRACREWLERREPK
jgi:thymidylate synthase